MEKEEQKKGIATKGNGENASNKEPSKRKQSKMEKDKGPNKRSEAEQKIIEEAKALLIERNGMTEPEAFRYIQKSSMDQGRTMAESAQMIIMLNG